MKVGPPPFCAARVFWSDLNDCLSQVWKGKREKVFFTMPEYETWKDENNGGRGWQNKYYKVSF